MTVDLHYLPNYTQCKIVSLTWNRRGRLHPSPFCLELAVSDGQVMGCHQHGLAVVAWVAGHCGLCESIPGLFALRPPQCQPHPLHVSLPVPHDWQRKKRRFTKASTWLSLNSSNMHEENGKTHLMFWRIDLFFWFSVLSYSFPAWQAPGVLARTADCSLSKLCGLRLGMTLKSSPSPPSSDRVSSDSEY